MNTTLSIMDPQIVRSRIFNTDTRALPRDAGMNLIETMAVMAIVAIIALGALPQVAKFIERANVQNMVSDTRNVAMQIESNFSITGKSQYVAADITKGIADTQLTSGTTITGTPSAADTTKKWAAGRGYELTATNTGVLEYTVKYNSLTGGVHIVDLTP